MIYNFHKKKVKYKNPQIFNINKISKKKKKDLLIKKINKKKKKLNKL